MKAMHHASKVKLEVNQLGALSVQILFDLSGNVAMMQCVILPEEDDDRVL
jgi:hypothetical protein